MGGPIRRSEGVRILAKLERRSPVGNVCPGCIFGGDEWSPYLRFRRGPAFLRKVDSRLLMRSQERGLKAVKGTRRLRGSQ